MTQRAGITAINVNGIELFSPPVLEVNILQFQDDGFAKQPQVESNLYPGSSNFPQTV
ncbi:MAG: hypothetical protein SynsKO_41710 [Synoicihabitans sp.]